jgi:diguanylate cyclase (GGDEF)-like protein
LIFCDIDYFKLYNDTYGHQAGDDCLRAVADKISANCQRPGDFVARYGGEEFIVILPNTEAEGAVHLAEDIREEIERLKIPHMRSQVSRYITLSLGVSSVFPSADSIPELLVGVADKALYEAKNQGRNRTVLKVADMEGITDLKFGTGN